MQVMLVGLGRIGMIHGSNLSAIEGVEIKYIVEKNNELAKKAAQKFSASLCDFENGLADKDVDAVIIASSTETHEEFIVKSCRAGKAIFCEKPIAPTLSAAKRCLQEINQAKIPFLIGFNRRFDPNFRSLYNRIRDGEIGNVEQVTIISRDPAPPSLEYLKHSGHLFKDMTIHDFDMARWLLGEEPSSIYAMGSCMVDQRIGDLGDIDQAMILLQTPSGKLCQITNSRRAVYGYDQRIEVLGSKGRISAGNQLQNTIEMAGQQSISHALPQFFFLERYEKAYMEEMKAFISAIMHKEAMPIEPEAAEKALLLSEAALKSYQNHQLISLN